ncbi:hypothetical protein ACFLQ8_00520 [Candidatus Auribacterota bacterium]
MGFYSKWSTGTFADGQWINVADKYLGLKFDIDGSMHYGWARITALGGPSLVMTLKDAAWETTAGVSISMGDMGGGGEVPDHRSNGKNSRSDDHLYRY